MRIGRLYVVSAPIFAGIFAIAGCGTSNPGAGSEADGGGGGGGEQADSVTTETSDETSSPAVDAAVPKGPLPPLVEDRSVYAQQTDTVLTIRLTGDPTAIDAVNQNVAGASAPVAFTADEYSSAGDQLNAQLSVHGATSRLAIQKSFKLKLNGGAPLWRGQRVLILNKHPYDLTRVRNRLSFEYLQTITNMTSARMQFVHLFINGTDMGLYTQVEYIDADFLSAHGLDPAGSLYNIQTQAFTPIDDKTAQDPMALATMVSDRANPDLPRLRRMLAAVNDPKQDINDVIARYFNRDNYVTWLAVNLLMEDLDTGSQNYILYSPSGYEGWYLLPWDYDGAWGWYEQPGEPPRARWRTGLANWWPVVLHQRFFLDPKNIVELTATVDRLMATAMSDAQTATMMARWHDVVKPFISKSPDLDNLPADRAGTPDAIPQWETEYQRVQTTVSAMSAEYVTSLSRPMPVFLYEPILRDPMVLSWGTSVELSGGPVTYDLTISRTAAFLPTDIIAEQIGLTQAKASVKKPEPGTYYWRVVIRDQSDPVNNWQQSFQDSPLIVPSP